MCYLGDCVIWAYGLHYGVWLCYSGYSLPCGAWLCYLGVAIVFITGYGCYLVIWLFYFCSMAFIWGMVILFWAIVRPSLGLGQHG